MCSTFAVEALNSSFARCKWVRVNETMYKPPCAVVLGVEDDDPVFGQVKQVYIVDSNRVVLYVQVMHTTGFNQHFHAYMIEGTHVYKTVLVDILYSPFPLHIRRLHICQIIIVKHHIVGTLQV